MRDYFEGIVKRIYITSECIENNLYCDDFPLTNKGINMTTNIDAANDNREYRSSALKMAYDALTPLVFGHRKPKISDLKELYELAEYNVNFILDKTIDIQPINQDEKLRKVIDKYK